VYTTRGWLALAGRFMPLQGKHATRQAMRGHGVGHGCELLPFACDDPLTLPPVTVSFQHNTAAHPDFGVDAMVMGSKRMSYNWRKRSNHA